MKTALICLMLLTLTSGGLLAGDSGSVLQRLDHELQTLAGRVDAAMVRISIPGVPQWTSFGDTRTRAAAVLALGYLYAAQTGKKQAQLTAAGVLVGTPPVLVTSADAVGSAKLISFELADGTTGSAKRKGIDHDLGVAVFTLPADVAAGLEGLIVHPSPRVRRGRLVMVPGFGSLEVTRPLSLALCRGSAPLRGWFRVDGLTGETLLGRPAIASDGRLIGIAAGSVGTTSGHTTLPIVLDGDQDGDYRAQRITWHRDESSLDSAAVKALKLLASGNNQTYTYSWPRKTQGDPLPEGSFIQGSSIARVLEDLEKHGEVRHAYLGVVLGQMHDQGEQRGVEVQAVLEGSPAESAGLTRGVVIRSVDGVLVEEPALVTRALVLHRPGDSMRIKLVGAEEVITVVLGDRAKETESLLTPAQLGLTCVELGSELASFLRVPAGTQGVVVRSVQPQSPAALAGLARGQVIVTGAGEAIADLEELLAAVAGAKGELKLTVLTGKVRKTLGIKIPASGFRTKAR